MMWMFDLYLAQSFSMFQRFKWNVILIDFTHMLCIKSTTSRRIFCMWLSKNCIQSIWEMAKFNWLYIISTSTAATRKSTICLMANTNNPVLKSTSILMDFGNMYGLNAAHWNWLFHWSSDDFIRKPENMWGKRVKSGPLQSSPSSVTFFLLHSIE